MAEAILNRAGGNRFHAMSAGLEPAQAVDPTTLEQLRSMSLPIEHCFTKPVQGFREESLISLDFIFSSLDLQEAGLARGWPGNPILNQWRIPDPMAFEGRESGRRNPFRSVFTSLQKRINLILDLPIDKIVDLSSRRSCTTGSPQPGPFA